MAKAKKERKSSEKLLVKIRERYKVMAEADRDNRRLSLDDLKFCNVPGEQWEQSVRNERGDRVCYEFNKIRPTVKRVVNEMRKNRPQGKVRAVEDGDKDTADVLEGLCRNIWNVSDADTVIDYAGEYQVGGGFGAWRVLTKYADDTAFDQDIVIEAIRNPYCLYADPACSDPLKRDARDWILTDRISKDAYEAKYGDKEKVNFESDTEFDDDDDWQDEETVRIVEYWYKEPVTKTIYQLQSGQAVDDLTGIDPATVTRSREVQTHKILMCIASGDAILEGPTEWAGTQFPFVVVYGDWLVIDGKIHWSGLVRHAKDAQRSYNHARTAISETIALTPQAKYWATPEQALGFEASWAEANKKNFPFQLYNADPKAGGPPQMMPGAQVPAALIQESQLASEEIKAVTGIFDASLGAQSNETSGRAINARQAQGEVATFNFADNMAKGIRRTYEILIDLIPKIYDSERSVRVLGVDGAEKYAKVNQVVVDPGTAEQVVINDLSRGKYDVAVTVGPSFTTQRQEAAETYTQLMQAMPTAAPFIADIAVKAMDLPYSDQVSERLKAMLPPQLQEQKDGKPLPPEVMQAMQQVDAAMQQVQEQGQMVQAAAQEAEGVKAEAEKAQSGIQQAIADLEIKWAKFDAHVAKQLADLTLKQAEATAAGVTEEAGKDRESIAGEMQKAVQEVQGMAAQFMQQAAATLAEIQAKAQPQMVMIPSPRVARVERVNGAMVPVYEDQLNG